MDEMQKTLVNMDEMVAAEARRMIYGSWCVYIGRCWPEWERQRCLYGKDQSHILFIEHLLMTHKHHCEELKCQSDNSNTSHASDADRETIAASAEYSYGAESVVRDRPQNDPAVEWTMDGKQANADHTAKEVDQESRTGLIPYFWAQTAPDGDTKDIVRVLRDTTLPLAIRQDDPMAGPINMSTKDNVSRLKGPILSEQDTLSTAVLATSSEMIETAQGTNRMLFTNNLEPRDIALDHYTNSREGNKIELEGFEEIAKTNSNDCSEYDYPDLEIQSKFELTAGEESDSAASGYDDADSPAQDPIDTDWVPSTSKRSLIKNDKTHSKTSIHPKNTDPNFENRTKQQNNSNEIPISEKKNTPTNKSPKLCPVCNREFKRLCDLKTHVRIHTGERPYLCSTCGNNYRTRTDLNHHMEVHKGRQLVCPDCGKTYATKKIFKTHLKSHSGIKPFVCTVCNKSFLLRKTLGRHSLIHSGERPYKCDTCGKGFNQSYNLTLHLRTHTGVVPFPCTVCGKAFKQEVSLRNHIKKHDVHD